MSRSPEEKRRLIGRLTSLRVNGVEYLSFPGRGHTLLGKPRNWPSETTLNTNRLNDRPITSFTFNNNPPAARRSPARLKEAVSWRLARAEARRIIERMMQK